MVAMGKITHQAVLADVAINAGNAEVRLAAVGRLTDAQMLLKVSEAAPCGHWIRGEHFSMAALAYDIEKTPIPHAEYKDDARDVAAKKLGRWKASEIPWP